MRHHYHNLHATGLTAHPQWKPSFTGVIYSCANNEAQRVLEESDDVLGLFLCVGESIFFAAHIYNTLGVTN